MADSKPRATSPVVWIIGALIVIAVAVLLLGGKAPTGGGYYGSSARATFTMTDAPPSMVAASSVYVVVQNISVHSMTTGQWYAVASPMKTYNLVALKSNAALLANATLPTGNYDQITMTVTAVNATVNGTVKPVKMPSSKLKIFGNFNFTSTANTSNTNWVNIDFRANQSLHATGNGVIIMLPVLQTSLHNNARVAAGYGGNATVQSQGSMSTSVESGMGVNGTMMANLVVPLNTTINIGANGMIGLGLGMGH